MPQKQEIFDKVAHHLKQHFQGLYPGADIRVVRCKNYYEILVKHPDKFECFKQYFRKKIQTQKEK